MYCWQNVTMRNTADNKSRLGLAVLKNEKGTTSQAVTDFKTTLDMRIILVHHKQT